MRVLILYKQKSEHRRKVDEYVRELKKEHPIKKVETEDVDTRDGLSTATLYDVMRYPAVLVIAEDGRIINHWEGENLPLISEVSYYASQ